MPWPAPAVALLCAVITTLATPAILRALPEPDPAVADGKPSYADLVSPSTLAGVAVASALAGLLVVAAVAPAQWWAWVALAGVGVVSAVIDARTTWLPLPLAHAGAAVAGTGALAAAITAGSWHPLGAAALGALALGGLFHLLWRVTGAFGYGDVRLAATIGAVTALDSAALVGWSLFLGTVAGAAIGVAHRVRGRDGAFPYGPGLLAGPFLALTLRLAAG